MLYILHWIILDAASECEDAEISGTSGVTSAAAAAGIVGADVGCGTGGAVGGVGVGLNGRAGAASSSSKWPPGYSYIHPIPTIQLFVFLFAPIVDRVKEGDLCFRLEGGKRLWRLLWNFEQPNIPCFAALVKPRKSIVKNYAGAYGQIKDQHTNTANIYFGDGSYREEDSVGGKAVGTAIEAVPGSGEAAAGSESKTAAGETGSSTAEKEKNNTAVSENQPPLTSSASSAQQQQHKQRTASASTSEAKKKAFADGRTSAAVDSATFSFFSGADDDDNVQDKDDDDDDDDARQWARPHDAFFVSFFDIAVLRTLFVKDWVSVNVHELW